LEYLAVYPVYKENNKFSALFNNAMVENIKRIFNVGGIKDVAKKFQHRNEVLTLIVKQFERENPFLHEVDKLMKTLEDMDRTSDRTYLSYLRNIIKTYNIKICNDFLENIYMILYATPQEASMHETDSNTFTETQAIDIANVMISNQYETFQKLIRAYFPAQELLEKEAAVEVKAPLKIDVKEDLFQYTDSSDDEDIKRVKAKAKTHKAQKPGVKIE
jgi:hypothetical protein